MRRLPHNPDMAVLADARTHLAAVLERADALREEATRHQDGKAIARLAWDRIAMASVDYVLEAPVASVVEDVRGGLRDFVAALKIGYLADSDEMCAAFFIALAVKDSSAAQFLTCVPASAWWPGTMINRFHAHCAFALHRNEPAKAAEILSLLYGLDFENEVPEDFQVHMPRLQNMYHLLDSLSRKSTQDFNRRLAQRMALLEELFRESSTNDPASLIDFHALGLVRLARARGMSVTLKHAYVPVEILGES